MKNKLFAQAFIIALCSMESSSRIKLIGDVYDNLLEANNYKECEPWCKWLKVLYDYFWLLDALKARA